MLKRPTPRLQRAARLALVCLGLLVVAACTRSATNNTALPPTATTGGAGISDGQPTIDQMDIFSTQLSADLTQTMVAAVGGAAATPGLPGDMTVVAPLPTTEPGVVATAAPPVLVATATPIPQPVSPTMPAIAGCPNPYTVQQGEWLYKIARQCGIDPMALIAANPYINPNRVDPGQVLNLPAAPAAGGGTCTGSYTVQIGDTMFRIASRCGLDVTQLIARNPGIPNPALIYPGDVIQFP